MRKVSVIPHVNPRSTRSGIALALAAVLVVFGFQGAIAAVSPAGCTSNNWGFDVDKNAAVVHVGDTIEYTVQATNGGTGACDVTDADVSFTYPDGTTEVLATGAVFPADGSGDATYGPFTYVVTKADADAEGGNIVTARVEGSGTVQDSDAGSGVTVFKDVGTIVWQPGVSVQKTASAPEAAPGDDIVFTILITNTGNAPLETVGLDDSMFGPLAGLGCDYVSPSFLDPGASCTIEIPYTVQESDPDPLYNVATVTFQDPLYTAGSEVTATDDATVPRPGTPEPVPGITIEKGPDYQEIVLGGSAGPYPSSAGAACSSEFEGKGPKSGKLRTYYFAFEDGTVATGVADSNETDVAGFAEPFHVSCSDSFPGGYGEKGSPSAPEPSIVWWAIWFDDEPYDVWAAGLESVKIENGEIGTATGIVVGGAVVTITSWIPKEGEEDEWIGFEYEVTGSLDSMTIKAGTEVFTIDDPGTSGTWIHPDGISGPDAKGISYVLFIEGEGPTSGEAVFTITVTNTGETDLYDVDVTDQLAPDCEAELGFINESGDRVFPQGESVTYECSVPGVTEGFTNVAVVAGTAPDGSAVGDSDDAVVAVVTTPVPGPGPGPDPDPDPGPDPEYPSSEGAMCSSDFEGKDKGKGKLRAYWFVFADGTEVSGTAEGNEVTVDGFSEPFHISCSDLFPGGYGEKGAPTAPESPLVWWAIWRFEADDQAPPVPEPSPDPEPAPDPAPAPDPDPDPAPAPDPGEIGTDAVCDVIELAKPKKYYKVDTEVAAAFVAGGPYGGMVYLGDEASGKLYAPDNPADSKRQYEVTYVVLCTGADTPDGDPGSGPLDPDEFRSWTETAGFAWNGDVPDRPEICEVRFLDKPKKHINVKDDDVLAVFVAGGPDGGMTYAQLAKYKKLEAPALDDKKTYKVEMYVVCTGDEAPTTWPESGPISLAEFHAWADDSGFAWTEPEE
jgi:uncharacterized repeat protein (TIGR01451 family)